MLRTVLKSLELGAVVESYLTALYLRSHQFGVIQYGVAGCCRAQRDQLNSPRVQYNMITPVWRSGADCLMLQLVDQTLRAMHKLVGSSELPFPERVHDVVSSSRAEHVLDVPPQHTPVRPAEANAEFKRAPYIRICCSRQLQDYPPLVLVTALIRLDRPEALGQAWRMWARTCALALLAPPAMPSD